jgi:hypothetical protein
MYVALQRFEGATDELCGPVHSSKNLVRRRVHGRLSLVPRMGSGKSLPCNLAKLGSIFYWWRVMSNSSRRLLLKLVSFLGVEIHMKISDSYIAETKHKVSTATHSIDFALASDAAYDAFASLVKALNIGVLGEYLFSNFSGDAV